MLSVLTYSIVNQPQQNNEIVEFITGGGAPAEQIRWLNLTTIAFPAFFGPVVLLRVLLLRIILSVASM
jgi:hypothetical protein